jgi:tRNA pseudouridine13 synthase
MADRPDDSARPAKRARLDDSAPSPLSAETSATAPHAATKALEPTAIETDLDREVRAGITEYVCPDNLGFTGVLKQRYTDFLVNEIGLDGQVLHLKSTEVPKKKGESDETAKATNGAKKEEPKSEKTVVEAVKGDAEMRATEVAGEATMPMPMPMPVKAEDAPKECGDTGEQVLGVLQPATKAEPEEEVGVVNCACASEVLTRNS